MATKRPVIVIVGPTASGKTALAIKIAKKYHGEIICADSRTVYEGMDIGTAKPSLEEQSGISHWGLDVALPSDRYTAAQFKAYAADKIAEIRARGKTPIVVGGTGLYVDSLIFDYQFPRPMSGVERHQFESLSTDELVKYCIENNIELPEDDKNKRRLLRAINDPDGAYRRRETTTGDFLVVGIATNKEILTERIHQRTEHMFDNGVVDEAIMLGKKYGWEAEAMTSNAYRVIKLHLQGELTLEETKELFTTRDVQLAKRQMTWFRRNAFIEWGQPAEITEYLGARLATEYNL